MTSNAVIDIFLQKFNLQLDFNLNFMTKPSKNIQIKFL